MGQQLVEVLVGRHDQVFAGWVGGDQGSYHVIGFPLIVLDPVDAEQVEAFVDTRQVGEDLVVAGDGGFVVG